MLPPRAGESASLSPSPASVDSSWGGGSCRPGGQHGWQGPTSGPPWSGTMAAKSESTPSEGGQGGEAGLMAVPPSAPWPLDAARPSQNARGVQAPPAAAVEAFSDFSSFSRAWPVLFNADVTVTRAVSVPLSSTAWKFSIKEFLGAWPRCFQHGVCLLAAIFRLAGEMEVLVAAGDGVQF